MTRRRFIADEFSSDHAALLGDHADHLARVLRARVGQEFDISAGPTVRRGKITQVENGRVDFDLFEEIPAPAHYGLTLLLAIYKFDRMEWAIEKCTELGVARIIPVISRRTDAHLAAASSKRLERWQRLALQASEQSRRASPPEISLPIKLAEALKTSEAMRIVLAETESHTQLRDLIQPDLHHPDLIRGESASSSIALAVGPEGGWTDSELESFQSGGWQSASLGQTILRAETAAIAATAIAMSILS